MKTRDIKLFALTAAIFMTMTASGCSKNDKDNYNSEVYEMYDGDIKFRVGSELEKYDVPYSFSTDFYFKLKDTDDTIEVSAASCMNETMKSYAEHVSELSKNDPAYSDVTCEPCTIHGLNGYKLVCSYADEAKGRQLLDVVEYGDLYYVVFIRDNNEMQEHIDKILDSVEFTGKPMRTEDETINQHYFRAVIPPEFIPAPSDLDIDRFSEQMAIRYALADDHKTAGYSMTLASFADMVDPAAEADTYAGCTRGQGEILGYSAETAIETDDDMTYTRYFFNTGTASYMIEIRCSGDGFINDLQKVFDGIEIKDPPETE